MKHQQAQSGFTLLELMVVISIFIVLSGLLLANQRKFSGNIALTNLSYDVALSIREAQTYGLALKSSGAGEDVFKSSYGLHFEGTAEYSLFLDVPSEVVNGKSVPDGVYTAAVDGAPQKVYALNGGVKITKLCATTKVGKANTCELSTLDLTFTRPYPDAKIKPSGTFVPAGETYAEASICLENNGRKKLVKVLQSGQIMVKDTTDCEI